ncbi:MAG: 50S ribosomal protein L25 [Deltaproteobacteria bacterium]|nr:50S ribosomal protein L25 [Deltaproteobacteria bacterium]MDD9854432.1 50S ribosomal protein L25 [Deltaproteobacteria bacterium]
MSQNELAAEPRSATGKGAARKLRATGRIPAVIYGRAMQTRQVSVDPQDLDKLLHSTGAGLNTLIDLQLEGAEQQVLLKALQRDPVHGAFLHADFYQVDLSQAVVVSVPLRVVGRAPGVELSDGILDLPLREIEIACLPTAIPDHIEADVSELQIGQSLHVSELHLPEGAELRTDSALAVALVAAPKVEEEEAEAEGEAPEGEETPAEPAEAEGKAAAASAESE